MELNSSLSSPRPPPQQLYSPHALGSCSACCLGYFCHLHFTFTSYSHQPLLSTSLWKTGGWWFIVYMQCSVINENSTSGQIIHPIALIQMLFKLHQDLFFFFNHSFSPLSIPSVCRCLIFPSHVYVSPSSLAHNLIWVVIIFSSDIYWSLQPAGLSA